MGYMVDGVYHVGDDVTKTLPSGAWERSRSTVRNWIGAGHFPAEQGRYHLFVAWTIIFSLRGIVHGRTVHC